VGAALRALFHRTHRPVLAVDGVSFDIAPGERVGFLGPNGAGKTSLLKMLAGLLYPTQGDVSVLGFNPHKRDFDFLRSIMLVTGQKQQLMWDLPPEETFELNRAIYDVPRAEYRRTLDELTTLLGLSGLIRKPTRQLSLGERMKCELAAALIHRPKVLFLDEPTIGLDVLAQGVVRRFLREYNERHRATIMLTSHYMEDVAALTPRVMIITRGRISYDGSLEDLVRCTRPEKRITLRLAAVVERSRLDCLGCPVVSLEDRHVVLKVGAAEMKPIISAAIASLPVEDLRVEDAPLEEVLAQVFVESSAAG
jgi:ABC-2 type transport system ATP-binding protein